MGFLIFWRAGRLSKGIWTDSKARQFAQMLKVGAFLTQTGVTVVKHLRVNWLFVVLFAKA